MARPLEIAYQSSRYPITVFTSNGNLRADPIRKIEFFGGAFKVAPADDNPLTHYQTCCLVLRAVGLTNFQAGRRIERIEDTVKTHMQHIYEKLGTSGIAGTVQAAFAKNIFRITQLAPALQSAPSERQLEVLEARGRGLTIPQTGSYMGVSPMTVRSHTTQLGRKIPTPNQAAMHVLYGNLCGLLPLDTIVRQGEMSAHAESPHLAISLTSRQPLTWSTDQLTSNQNLETVA